MRILIELLKKFPLDVQPTDTGSDVKERIRDILFKQMAKKGEDVTDIDVTLVFRGVKLDDGISLEASGVTQGATLTLLSRALAEVHGRHSGVTSVKQAFRELAKKGDAGEGAETDALSNCKPFGLLCDVSELGELGTGWVLFFHFVRSLGLLCLLLFVVQLPALFHYRSFGSEPITLWSNQTADKKSAPISASFLTVGNTGPEGSESPLPWLCALATAVLTLGLLAHYSRFQSVTKQQVDATEVDPNDFALFIEGLPSDAIDEAEIKAFVEENAREGHHTSVVNVVIGYDLEVFTGMLTELGQAKKDMAEATDEREKALLKDKAKELSSPLLSEGALRSFLPCTGNAIVVLRSQADHRESLAEWDTWYESAATSCECLEGYSRQPRFRDAQVLRISRAANPTDIVWENFGVSMGERYKARAKTYGMVAFIFGVTLAVVLVLDKLSERLGNPGWMSILPTLSVLTIRIWASVSIKKFVVRQRHMTKTDRDLAIMAKLALFYVLSYCVIAILVNRDPFAGEWYSAGGLLIDINTLMIMNCFSIPLSILSGCTLCIRRTMRDARVDLENPPVGLKQTKYQSMFELPEMDQSRSLAKVLITFLTGLLFMPMYPFAILVAAAGLFCEYWAYKYQLLRQSKRPYRQSHEVSYGSLKIVYLGVAGFAITQSLFLAPSLAGSANSWSETLTYPLIAISVFMLCMPAEVNRLLCGTIFCQKRHAKTDTDVDYYVAQKAWPKHQKYHTTNLVYLHGFEMLAMKARRLEWDPRTGNFKDPEARGEAAAGSEAASAPRPGTLTVAGEAPEEHEGEAGAGDESSDDDEGPEYTGAIAMVDPAALAMEELKVKVPLSMLGDHPSDSEDTEDGLSESDDSDSEDLEAVAPPFSAAALRPGVTARIDGLKSASADKFNGTNCTIKSWDKAAGKWIVELDNGGKARLPTECLRPLTVHEQIRAGSKVRIVNLASHKAQQYNDTVGTVVDWNDRARKWNVKLFTGIKATIPASNLEVVEHG
mmetsp:Transcript_76473/g.137983  ORF Transcript_76473/g.137983 Transcript_76473/m.137983 type:complete len:1003 (-) Transcript_76473:22-3030(-)